MLMADGTTKAIDHVRVGDTITNSVPGATGTEAHKVTAVIVTHTDHDFVDLTIKKTAKSAAKQSMAGGEKSLARKVARKATFGLAASAAVLGALAASHGHGHGQEPATAPVAAVSTVSTQDTKAVVGTETAQNAHLTTTFHHPFYDETQAAFVDAKDLHTGMSSRPRPVRLRSPVSARITRTLRRTTSPSAPSTPTMWRPTARRCWSTMQTRLPSADGPHRDISTGRVAVQGSQGHRFGHRQAQDHERSWH